MEALLRRDMAAAADLTPISWSVADSLTEQIYAVADETIKSEHRVKDDPTLFGIWNALVTRIIATSSEEFRGAGCQAALRKELSTLRDRQVWDDRGDGVRMVRCMLRSRAQPVWAACLRPWGRARRGAEGPRLAHLQGQVRLRGHQRADFEWATSLGALPLRHRPRCRQCAQRWPSRA